MAIAIPLYAAIVLTATGASTQQIERAAAAVPAYAAPNPATAGNAGEASTRMRPATAAAITCLASAMWHEAGNQPRAGMIAVGEVVLARTRSVGFPSDVCQVVLQPSQFSFVIGGRLPAVPAERREALMRLARQVMKGSVSSGVRGAMFFHADYVSPNWGLQRVGQIGDHIFYSQRRSASVDRTETVEPERGLPTPGLQQGARSVGREHDPAGLAEKLIDGDHPQPPAADIEPAVEAVVPVVA